MTKFMVINKDAYGNGPVIDINGIIVNTKTKDFCTTNVVLANNRFYVIYKHLLHGETYWTLLLTTKNKVRAIEA